MAVIAFEKASLSFFSSFVSEHQHLPLHLALLLSYRHYRLLKGEIRRLKFLLGVAARKVLQRFKCRFLALAMIVLLKLETCVLTKSFKSNSYLSSSCKLSFLDPIVIKVYIGDNNEYGKLEFEVSFFLF